jgi:hypothetical protein
MAISSVMPPSGLGPRRRLDAGSTSIARKDLQLRWGGSPVLAVVSASWLIGSRNAKSPALESPEWGFGAGACGVALNVVGSSGGLRAVPGPFPCELEGGFVGGRHRQVAS